MAAAAEDLFQHFKDVNFDESLENSSLSNTLTQNVNEEINVPFTEYEIRNAIKRLKNNKATGVALILNEHLKKLSHIISSILVDLFNLVFDTGIIPESWTLCTSHLYPPPPRGRGLAGLLTFQFSKPR